MQKARVLSSNMIKIIAAIAMLIDHVGLILFPRVYVLRYIGRLAFPMFAFMIAEGAKYTRSKLKYFLNVFLVGVICQIVNYIFNSGSLEMCSLITFSVSILLLYLMFFSKKIFFNEKLHMALRIGAPVLIMSMAIILVYFLNRYVDLDYGFWGCLLPLFAGLLDFRGIEVPEFFRRLDSFYARLFVFGIGVWRLSHFYGGAQYLGLLCLPLLLLYSEKRGTLKMKYFFYLFFPIHLALIYGIAVLIQYIG